jgi:MAM domain.
MFRGTVGRSYTGDIAVDDILIIDGECPKAGKICHVAKLDYRL